MANPRLVIIEARPTKKWIWECLNPFLALGGKRGYSIGVARLGVRSLTAGLVDPQRCLVRQVLNWYPFRVSGISFASVLPNRFSLPDVE